MERIQPKSILFVIFISLMIGFFIGYFYLKLTLQPEVEKILITQQQNYGVEPIEEEVKEVSVTEERITPSTKIVYRYYYTEDGITEEAEEVPPYFLLDLTLDDMLKYYTTWEIIAFSSKEVVMQKTIIGSSNQRYVIGEKNGYIAVFYEEEQQGISLKELTDIPVNGLGEEDRLQLREGIKVIGEESLARVLENYSS